MKLTGITPRFTETESCYTEFYYIAHGYPGFKYYTCDPRRFHSRWTNLKTQRVLRVMTECLGKLLTRHVLFFLCVFFFSQCGVVGVPRGYGRAVTRRW